MDAPSRRESGSGHDELIESHLWLARAIAHRFRGSGEPLDDLMQVGALGLIRARSRFDPDRGVAFAAFAAGVVEGEIRRHLAGRADPVRLPRRLRRLQGAVATADGELTTRLGRSPSAREIAALLGVSEHDVQSARAGSGRGAESASDAARLAVAPVDAHAASEARLLLERCTGALDERERQVVFLRYRADMTERAIASVLGISQAQVSRDLNQALAKMRRALDGDITATRVISPAARRPPGRKVQQRGAARSTIAVVDGARDSRAGAAPKRRGAAGEKAGYSGRVLVRMPAELHEQLARSARDANVSLNQFVTTTLAAGTAASTAPAEDPVEPTTPARPRRERGLRWVVGANLTLLVFTAVVAIVLLVLALERGI